MAKKPTYEELEEKIKELEGEAVRIKKEDVWPWECDEKYRLLVDNLKLALTMYDFDGNIFFMNNAGARYWGMLPEDVVGKSLHDLFPDVSELMVERARQVYESGVGFEVEDELPFPGGKRWFYSNLQPVKNQSGSIVAVQTISHDITERKQVAKTLQDSEEQFRSLVEATSDWIWEVGQDGIYTYISPRVKDLLGYEPEEIIGKTPFDLMPPDEAERVGTIFSEIIASRRSFERMENVNLHLKGHTVVIETSGVPIFDSNGNFTGYRGIDRDITKRKIAEEELAMYQGQLENLVKERTKELEAAQKELIKSERLAVLGRLIATFSHELRNPLSVIKSSIFYLHKKLRAEDQKTIKHIKRIDEQLEQCNSIIKDLMDYSRGRRSVVFPKDLNSFLNEATDHIISEEQSDIFLVSNFSSELPPALFDEEKMRIVLENIFNNANHAIQVKRKRLIEKGVKYKPIIKVTTSISENGIKVEIEDNGIGMDKETQNQAFDPLFTTETQGSTGLGLAIVKKIIEEHNGIISIQSEPDKGTKVRLVIPMHNCALKKAN